MIFLWSAFLSKLSDDSQRINILDVQSDVTRGEVPDCYLQFRELGPPRQTEALGRVKMSWRCERPGPWQGTTGKAPYRLQGTWTFTTLCPKKQTMECIMTKRELPRSQKKTFTEGRSSNRQSSTPGSFRRTNQSINVGGCVDRAKRNPG